MGMSAAMRKRKRQIDSRSQSFSCSGRANDGAEAAKAARPGSFPSNLPSAAAWTLTASTSVAFETSDSMAGSTGSSTDVLIVSSMSSSLFHDGNRRYVGSAGTMIVATSSGERWSLPSLVGMPQVMVGAATGKTRAGSATGEGAGGGTAMLDAGAARHDCPCPEEAKAGADGTDSG